MVGGRPPSLLEVLVAAEEIVGRNALLNGRLESVAPQHDPETAYAGGPE